MGDRSRGAVPDPLERYLLIHTLIAGSPMGDPVC